MSTPTVGMNSEPLGAYFALMEVSSLLQYAVDEHLLSQLRALLAILSTGIVYGTDAFCARDLVEA